MAYNLTYHMTYETLEVCLIKWGSDQYQQELQLRDDVLRKPLGLSLFDEDLSQEERDTHVGAFRGRELVGTLVLSARADHLRMRQVAVAGKAQGQNVGTQMMEFAERLACEMGYSRIELHARQSAVGFYQRNGYCGVGEQFKEIGLVHLTMVKSLSCV